jgi:hypothetical protein
MSQQIGATVRWTGPIAILVVHAMALGLLFLLLAVVGHAFVDHYKAIGIGSTPRFEMVSRIADFLSRSSIAFFAVVITDALIIRWIAKKPARWLSAYSHTYLASIVFVMFIAITWMIHPMVWNAPKAGAVQVNQAVASIP